MLTFIKKYYAKIILLLIILNLSYPLLYGFKLEFLITVLICALVTGFISFLDVVLRIKVWKTHEIGSGTEWSLYGGIAIDLIFLTKSLLANNSNHYSFALFSSTFVIINLLVIKIFDFKD